MDGKHASCNYGCPSEVAARRNRLRLGENVKLHFKRGRFGILDHSANQASSSSPKELEKKTYIYI